MNKKEAIAFIKSEFEKGTPEGEIVEVLMSQGKIGTTKPTLDNVSVLMIEVKATDADVSVIPDEEQDSALKKTESRKPLSGCNYEKWKVDVKTDEKGNVLSIDKNKKLKDVRIDDETTEQMNEAMMFSGKGYAIQFYPKK